MPIGKPRAPNVKPLLFYFICYWPTPVARYYTYLAMRRSKAEGRAFTAQVTIETATPE